MNFSERFDVSPSKLEALFTRITRLQINPAHISESFTRGGGKGGQKINKTSNCVQLHYAPLDLSARCQRERKRTINRFIALRELVDQIEMKISPGTSARLKEIKRLKKNKASKQRRSQDKYGRTS